MTTGSHFTCVGLDCTNRATCPTCMWCDTCCPCVSATSDCPPFDAFVVPKAKPGERKKVKKMSRETPKSRQGVLE